MTLDILTISFIQPYLQRSLPELEKQMETKLKETHAKLDKLGCGPPTDCTERLGFLIDVSLMAGCHFLHVGSKRVTKLSFFLPSFYLRG